MEVRFFGLFIEVSRPALVAYPRVYTRASGSVTASRFYYFCPANRVHLKLWNAGFRKGMKDVDPRQLFFLIPINSTTPLQTLAQRKNKNSLISTQDLHILKDLAKIPVQKSTFLNSNDCQPH